MAWSESKTVDSSTLNESQDLIILKILKSLKALRTDKLESESGMINSTKLMQTMKQSKMLKLSLAYAGRPNPIILMTISTAKIPVKK
jgi:hypothetical protein